MNYFLNIILFFTFIISQAQIYNSSSLNCFVEKLNKNEEVTQIVMIGDSHIQAGWFTEPLRKQFQKKYGNAGRGLVFPYAVANTNGPGDYTVKSNVTWESFRLVYDQNVFPQMGISGFVMGNHTPSLLEFNLATEDSFDQIFIFNDNSMQGEPFEILSTSGDLNKFTTKNKKIKNITIRNGITFPELAAQYYTTTTRLNQLNNKKSSFKIGKNYRVEGVFISYDDAYLKDAKLIYTSYYRKSPTFIDLPQSLNRIVLKTNAKSGNTFYGFQFLKNTNQGIVFNTIGVNGATYEDFSKYSLPTRQINSIHPDLIIIALGTNESISNITKNEFKSNAKKLINNLRNYDSSQSILLVSPVDNNRAPEKVQQISKWVKEIAEDNNTAFYDMYQATGAEGYFNTALKRNQANRDGVHFLKSGYESQAQRLYNAIQEILN